MLDVGLLKVAPKKKLGRKEKQLMSAHFTVCCSDEPLLAS